MYKASNFPIDEELAKIICSFNLTVLKLEVHKDNTRERDIFYSL